jgi:Fe-Mn family superoxide dismutase
MTKIYNSTANQTKYPFVLPDLPFSKDAFGDDMSAETFDYHHGKHHNAYVNTANKLLEDHELNQYSLEAIIQATYGVSSQQSLFNQVAQIWNHTFFWHCLSPESQEPEGKLLEQINKDFGSLDEFKEAFKQAAITQFGSGWAWLVWNKDQLEVRKTLNALNPITEGVTPLLTCDVWEHAYYIDYRNRRPDYVSNFLEKLVNWKFVAANFEEAS